MSEIIALTDYIKAYNYYAPGALTETTMADIEGTVNLLSVQNIIFASDPDFNSRYYNK